MPTQLQRAKEPHSRAGRQRPGGPGAGRVAAAATRGRYLAATASQKFTEIAIKRFRGLRDIALRDLRRINLVAGISGSGKTTVLEAVKLLCSLTATHDFLALVRDRGKIKPDGQVDAGWLLAQVPSLELSAQFAGQAVSLQVEVKGQELDKMAQYLQSACFKASYAQDEFVARAHFFENCPSLADGQAVSLCPSALSTSFSRLDAALLQQCHGGGLNTGCQETVINFLRENVDHEIKSIELDDSGHFLVSHKSIKGRQDLTLFGDTLQRIFKLGLLFPFARKGVVIIDEFENAIHPALFPKLAKLVQHLAKRFNVQVFICSHSKECIDAFSKNVPQEDISYYGFIEYRDGLRCQHFSGNRLPRLIKGINFDLRGAVRS